MLERDAEEIGLNPPRRRSLMRRALAPQRNPTSGSKPRLIKLSRIAPGKVPYEARRHDRPLAPGGHAGRAARHRARGGQRHARGRPRPQDRAAPAGRERRARPAARQQLARQALPEPEARRREPGLHQGAADHPRVRRGRGDPEQARALSRDPDRERAEEGHRRQADQPEHLSGAPLRAAPVRASAKRTVAPGGGRLAGLVQPARPASCEASGVRPIGPGAAARV